MNFETFKSHCDSVIERVEQACERAGRPLKSLKIMAVTKTRSDAEVEAAVRYGFTLLGENRVQEAVDKQTRLSGLSGQWELIGHLQRNKAQLAAEHFARVQSVDSARLATALERGCAAVGRERLPILLQVNAGDDPAKFGVALADAPALLEHCLGCAHLEVQGLMTLAPLSDDPAVARHCFARLRGCCEALRARYGLPLTECSMGMSGDFEAAILEGSTLLRLGSILFGPRP